MRMPRRALLAPALTLAVLAGAGPALADEPTPTPTETIATAPPDQPEESDLIEGAPETPAPAPSDAANHTGNSPDGRGCEQGWSYHATSKKKDYHKGVGTEQANFNGSPHTAKSTFVSEVSGTVGIAFSGELKVSADVAVVEVEGNSA